MTIFIIPTFFLFSLTMYIAMKNKGVRASKYAMFIGLTMYSFSLIIAKPDNIFIHLFFLLIAFSTDELLSIIPWAKKYNKIHLIAKFGHSTITYQSISDFDLGEKFPFGKSSYGVKIKETEQTLKFIFKSTEIEKTPYYMHDFVKVLKPIEGQIKITKMDSYSNKSTVLVGPNETITLSPFTLHCAENIQQKCKVETTCYKPNE